MDAGGLLERFAPPPGDAGQVRAAAGAWRSAADRVQALTDASQAQVWALGTGWEGQARDAFGASWQGLVAALAGGCDELRAAAAALERAADAIEEARARYWQVLAGAGLAVAVGLVLTPVTAGLSDVVADGVAAGELGVVLASLAEVLGVEASVLAGVAGAAARLAATFAVQVTAAVAGDAVAGAVVRPDHNPVHLDLRTDAETALAGALAGPWHVVLGGAGARLVPGLVGAGASIGAGTARLVLDGAAFGLGDATAQVALDRRVDPGIVAVASLGAIAGAGAGRALARSAGGHGAGSGVPPLPSPAALDARLRAILARSTAVPAGRSFFDADHDPWLARSVSLVPPEDGAAVVFLHGSPTAVIAAGRQLGPQELAALVRADPRLAGRPVRLFACETGRLDDGFAHQLARELGMRVHAPTELAWLGPSGEISTTSGRLVGDAWVLTVPHDGRWRTFRPDGTVLDTAVGTMPGTTERSMPR
jgi:WXG100 family type VII secretion target